MKAISLSPNEDNTKLLILWRPLIWLKQFGIWLLITLVGVPFVYGEKNTVNLQSRTDLVLNPAESVRNWFVPTCKVGYGNMKLRSIGFVFA